MKNILLAKISFLLIICFFISVFGLVGCKQAAKDAKSSTISKKLTVAVSIVPQETFVKAVAGDLVDIVVLVPPGNSPANYAPSPQELVQLSNSSLYFSIGVPTEKANILPRLSDINQDLKIIDLAGNVAKVYPEREFAPGNRDPHIWLSPKRVEVMVETIARELSRIDSQNKTIYQKNAKEYMAKLDELDEKIQNSLAQLSERTFFVYHPAFGYFADDYQLTMVAIEKSGKGATIEDLQNIIDLAKEKNIKVIFYQAENDSSQARTIAEEIGGKSEMIAPLASNYIENLEKTAETFANVLK